MPTVKSPALKPLLQSPQLPTYVREMQSYLDEESQQKREAFYDWITPDIKAEFINGEIVVQSPAKKRHTDASMNLSVLLSTYVELHNLGFVAAETVLNSLTRNDYLPDICFFGREKTATIEPEQMKYLAPDFIVEILSPSTADVDRNLKAVDYAAHEVAEYWLVDPEQGTVEQYLLQDERYKLHLKINTGFLSSAAIQGFTIPVEAVFDSKLKNRVLAQLLAAAPAQGETLNG
jgi:Uma2 family endonuclease